MGDIDVKNNNKAAGSRRRSAIRIMGSLIGLVKPLIHIMMAAIILGTLGYLCAIFLTILAGQVIVHGLLTGVAGMMVPVDNMWLVSTPVKTIITVMIIIAVLRGILHYMEQYCNHFIAFKLLAIIRHKVFAALRKLCPAKLEGCDKGNLISIITTDIELLEVFYAHTISPIAIATLTSIIMVIFIGRYHWLALTIRLYDYGAMGFEGILTCTIAMMGSFGPVVALSSLSNNLNQTLASGERVLSLLEETPLVEEIPGDVETAKISDTEIFKDETEEHSNNQDVDSEARVDYAFAGAAAENVIFAYEEETILDNYSLKLEPGKITGIHGASGSGKSTLLKLLMRFWDVQAGSVSVDGTDVRKIPTKHLRDMESYVTQETHLFHDSIANNIAIAKQGASREEIMEAAKKASIHDFIMTLPKGYDTEVGELGDTLSGGEKQRIGIARAFLHDSPLILLDEPTSNLDSLNEGIILKSLKESALKKTVVLVSHRVSTMNVADVVYEMENGRIS